MKYKNAISILTVATIVMALTAALLRTFSDNGSSLSDYHSIQDMVTLIMGIPLLLISLFLFRKESIKGKLLLTGTLGYFFVTYLLYTATAGYDIILLYYALISLTSFLAIVILTATIIEMKLSSYFNSKASVSFVGVFLLFSSVLTALSWQGIVAPTFNESSITPSGTVHYTRLIVYGLNFGLLLPLALLSGLLLIKRVSIGYGLSSVYIIFSAILMTALTARIMAMNSDGADVFPAVIVVPLFNLIAILCAIYLLNNVREPEVSIESIVPVSESQMSIANSD